MATYRLTVTSNGRPLPNATVTFYAEDASRSAFADKQKITVYSDRDMTVEAANPQLSSSLGEVNLYIPSQTDMAIKVTRPGYGERLVRDVSVLGADAS